MVLGGGGSGGADADSGQVAGHRPDAGAGGASQAHVPFLVMDADQHEDQQHQNPQCDQERYDGHGHGDRVCRAGDVWHRASLPSGRRGSRYIMVHNFARKALCARVCTNDVEDANFRGRSLEMGPDDAVDFGGGFWNDRVSSVLVRRGCTLVAYEHSGMRGRSIELNRRVRNFGGSGWNDRISSAECYCDRY